MNYYNYSQAQIANANGIAAINGCTVPWFTGDKISQISSSVSNIQDIYNTELFNIIFASNDAFNIFEDLEIDGNTTYCLYFVKTNQGKLLGIITCEKYNPHTFKVIMEFEFVPEMIFFQSLYEILSDIVSPFSFSKFVDENYDTSEILDQIRAMSMMILLENPVHKNMSISFKNILLSKLNF